MVGSTIQAEAGSVTGFSTPECRCATKSTSEPSRNDRLCARIISAFGRSAATRYITIGGPQIPDSPPKKPPTSADAGLDPAAGAASGTAAASRRAGWRRRPTPSPRGCAKSARSGSATTSCADSAIITTSTRFSHQNRAQAPERRPDAVAQRLEQVRDQHRHDQERHRHVVGHERAGDAEPRSAAARSRRRPWRSRPRASAAVAADRGADAVLRDKSFQPGHVLASSGAVLRREAGRRQR